MSVVRGGGGGSEEFRHRVQSAGGSCFELEPSAAFIDLHLICTQIKLWAIKAFTIKFTHSRTGMLKHLIKTLANECSAGGGGGSEELRHRIQPTRAAVAGVEPCAVLPRALEDCGQKGWWSPYSSAAPTRLRGAAGWWRGVAPGG